MKNPLNYKSSITTHGFLMMMSRSNQFTPLCIAEFQVY